MTNKTYALHDLVIKSLSHGDMANEKIRDSDAHPKTAHRVLVILVEGYDDRQFFERIIVPRIHQYDNVIVSEYADIFFGVPKHDDDIDINTLAMKSSRYLDVSKDDWDYFLVADRDNDFRSDGSKLDFLKKYIIELEDDKVIIVNRAIESWYAAGIAIGSTFYPDIRSIPPEQITKKYFEKLAKRHDCTNSQLKGMILDQYDLRTGMSRSPSLKKALITLGVCALTNKTNGASKEIRPEVRKARTCPECQGTGHCKCINPQLKARIKKDDHGNCTLCQGSEKCQLCSGSGSLDY